MRISKLLGLYAVCTCCGKEVKRNDKKVSTNNNC